MLYAFNIAKNPVYNGYQHGLASMVCISLIKKLSGDAIKKNMQNEELGEELHKPNNRTFEKSTLIFYRKIRGPDHADMELISKFNKGFRFLLFVIDIYSKYAWVFPLKAKKKHYNYYFFSKS